MRSTRCLDTQLPASMRSSAICLDFTGDIGISSRNTIGAAMSKSKTLSSLMMLLVQIPFFRSLKSFATLYLSVIQRAISVDDSKRTNMDQEFHLFLLTAYSARPWYGKIGNREYILESNDLTKEVQSRSWNELMKSGETIRMTMLFKRTGVLSDTSCRQCRAVNVRRIRGNRKIEW
jgi:hypothetical protein